MPHITILPRCCLLLGWALASAALPAAVVAHAQSTDVDLARVRAFDIAPQALNTALIQFGEVTGIPLLHESTRSAGRRTQGVRGRLTPREALTRLLAGTGFEGRFTREGAVIIAPTGTEHPLVLRLAPLVVAPPPALGTKRNHAAYAQIVYRDVYKALRANAGTRQHPYTVRFRIWLTTTGEVARSALAATTGDSVLDAALVDALQSVTVSQPPPDDLPQPLKFELRFQ